MALDLTGDAAKNTPEVREIVLNPIDIITAARLADIDDVINSTDVSGKRAGGAILSDNGTGYILYVAQGPAKDDLWLIPDGTVTGAITPA